MCESVRAPRSDFIVFLDRQTLECAGAGSGYAAELAGKMELVIIATLGCHLPDRESLVGQ